MISSQALQKDLNEHNSTKQSLMIENERLREELSEANKNNATLQSKISELESDLRFKEAKLVGHINELRQEGLNIKLTVICRNKTPFLIPE